ncbi:GntR family transcriptional regulator [Siminovitchia acidinfaciens]|uniref:GntR family transcriptional regulator n=1 Tax=Siminovitchia acidinfaciens TaxID=2321395 RepID=UPI0013DF53FC|nr:GntR family transcriptional regulator [Siminovitchia acidinfaciens]
MGKKLSLEDYVYIELKRAIFNRQIPLNTQLNEELLSEAFNVSRTPIRSVLKRMQHEKIIQIIPRKGAYINQPTFQEIENVFQLRILIEKEAIKIACSEATDKQLNALIELTYEEEELFRSGEYADGLRVTSEFHQSLIKLTKNDLMIEYSQELINITNIYLVFHETAKKESPRSPEEHREIVRAIQMRNEKEALRLFDQHIKSIKDNLNRNKSENTVEFDKIFKPYSKQP